MTAREMQLMFLDYMDDSRGRIWGQEKTYRFLNRGLEHVANMLTNEDRNDNVTSTDFSIASGTGDVENALPTNFISVHMVEKIVSGQRPIPLSSVDFRNRDYYWRNYPGLSASNPDLYYIKGTVFGITSPSEAYTVRLHYKRSPTLLIEPTDTPEYPSPLHNAMILHAVTLAKPSILAVNGFQQIYDRELQKVILSSEGRDGEIQYKATDPEDMF